MQETQKTWVLSLGWKDFLEKEVATHSSILVWKIPWTEEPGGLQSMESQSRTRLSVHTCTRHPITPHPHAASALDFRHSDWCVVVTIYFSIPSTYILISYKLLFKCHLLTDAFREHSKMATSHSSSLLIFFSTILFCYSFLKKFFLEYS